MNLPTIIATITAGALLTLLIIGLHITRGGAE